MADKYVTKLEKDKQGNVLADPVIIVGGSTGGNTGGNVTVNGQAADSSGNIELNAKHITSTDGNIQADIDALKAGIHPASTENQAIVSLRRDLDDLQKRHSAFATTTLADLANKLDLDLGNVQDAGFLEKLRDAKVAFRSDIPKPAAPVVPVGQTTSVSYQEIHEQDNRMLKLNTDVNFINLQLPSTGREFAVTLPQSKAGTTIILGSMIHPEDSTPDSVQVNAPTGWQIQGGSSYTETNVVERWLYIVSTGTGYLVGKMFSKEETEKESDVTISDSIGHSIKGNNFILGRGIVIRTDKSSGTSVYEDSPEAEVSVDGVQSYAQLSENNVIDLAPAVYNELIGNDGFYGKLGREEELRVPTTKKSVKAKLYTEDVIVDTKGYIQKNRADKSFGIQDALNDDPNISGGQPTVIASILSMIGVAPEDGTVTFYILDEYTGQPIEDVFGRPMQVSKDYKQGDKLGKLHLEDVVMDKGIRNISLWVEPTFKSDSVVIAEDTCLMIQYITEKHQTGEALRTFEQENDIDITWYKEYVGKDFFNFNQYLDEDIPMTDLNVGDGMLGNDGVQFYPATKLKAGIKDRVLTITDNGTDMAYFNDGIIFSPEQTILLEDGEVDIDVVTEAKNDAYKVYLVGTKSDNPTTKVITDNVNDAPVLESDWTIIDDKGFIEENVDGTFKGNSFNYFIPLGYKQVGILFAPVTKQYPMSFSLKSFTVSSTKNRVVWFINKPTFKEDEYKFYNGTAKFDMNTSNRFAALRYTINSKATKIPVGVTSDKDLSNVMAWKDSGYAGEGVIEAKQDMEITNLSVSFNRTLFFGEKKAKDANEQLTTWFTIGNNPDNPIPGSEERSMFTPSNPPSTRAFTHSTDVNLKLNKGEDIWFWCKALNDDGLFIQAPTNGVLLEIDVTYKDVKKI